MKKPAELAYGVDEKPPGVVTWLSAAQHVAVLAVVMIFPVLVSREAGASPAAAAGILSAGMLAMGLATILQASSRGPLGSGYLAPTGFQAVYLGPSLAAAKLGGLPLVFGMTIFAGLIEAAVSRLWRPLRPYFPPELSGLVVLFTAMAVAALGIRYLLGESAGEPARSLNWAVAGLTLVTMVALNLWTRGMPRMFCALIGTVAGYVVAVWLGLGSVQELAAIAASPLVDFPRFEHLAWSFDLSMALPFAVSGVAAAMNTSANLTIFQRLNDAEWVRPDLGSISRATLTDGLASSASGAIGSCGISTLSASVGVVVATGVSSRRIAYSIGAIVFVLAFLPKFTAVLVAIPGPVVAGALLFMSCFILIAGMQILTSRMLDARKTLVIGFSVAAALAVLMFPAASAGAPIWLQSLLDSPLVAGTLVALALNLAFRVGVRQKVGLAIDVAANYAKAIEDFFMQRGAVWGARPDVIRRAVFGVTQLAETVIENCNPQGPLAIEASFDEFNLEVHVSYVGDLLELPESRPTDREIRESEDGTRRLAGFMLRRNADRAQSMRQNGRAIIHFHFDH